MKIEYQIYLEEPEEKEFVSAFELGEPYCVSVKETAIKWAKDYEVAHKCNAMVIEQYFGEGLNSFRSKVVYDSREK